MDAPILRVIPQRHESDCAVACLAMLIGVSYDEALVALSSVEPHVLKRGAWMKQVETAAQKLGVRLARKRKYDLESDTGLLRVSSDKHGEHVVVLKAGLIVETDGTIWDSDVYLSNRQATTGTLLVCT